MKIKLDYQKIKDQDEETFELFREFIDRVVASEVFRGSDPQQYDLIDITADIEIEIETEHELDNDDFINEAEMNNALFDEGDTDEWDAFGDNRGPLNDFSDDDIDNIFRD